MPTYSKNRSASYIRSTICNTEFLPKENFEDILLGAYPSDSIPYQNNPNFTGFDKRTSPDNFPNSIFPKNKQGNLHASLNLSF